MREKGQTEVAKTLETPVFSRGIEILTEKQQFVDPITLRTHFWNVFVVDALLGNFDRHNGNWGFLYDPAAKKSEISPVFDCGSCLLPQADEEVMHNVLSDSTERDLRIFRFPTSALKLEGRKINYYDFLTQAKYADCNQAVRRIYERINMGQIASFIDGVPYLTDLQRQFYKSYISDRLDLILKPAYENLGS